MGVSPMLAAAERLCVEIRQVLYYVGRGLTDKEIARRLDIDEETVNSRLRRLYRALGATNRPEAVRLALREGYDLDAFPAC